MVIKFFIHTSRQYFNHPDIAANYVGPTYRLSATQHVSLGNVEKTMLAQGLSAKGPSVGPTC